MEGWRGRLCPARFPACQYSPVKTCTKKMELADNSTAPPESRGLLPRGAAWHSDKGFTDHSTPAALRRLERMHVMNELIAQLVGQLGINESQAGGGAGLLN